MTGASGMFWSVHRRVSSPGWVSKQCCSDGLTHNLIPIKDLGINSIINGTKSNIERFFTQLTGGNRVASVSEDLI